MARNEIIFRGVPHSPLKIVKNARDMQIYSSSLEENKKLNMKNSLVNSSFFNYTDKAIIFVLRLSSQLVVGLPMMWLCMLITLGFLLAFQKDVYTLQQRK